MFSPCLLCSCNPWCFALVWIPVLFLSLSPVLVLCPDTRGQKLLFIRVYLLVEVEQFYEDLQDLLELTTKKRCPLHYRGLESKSRKSRDTWRNRQIWPWSTEWSRAKANRVCQQNTLLIENTLFKQHKRRLYTWTSPDGQHQNKIDYILCSQR